MLRLEKGQRTGWIVLGFAAVVTLANLGYWAFSEAKARAAAVQPVKAVPYMVFADGKTFTVAIKKSNGANFGAMPTAAINLRQMIGGSTVVTPWTNVTVTKFAADASIIGIRATAKRGVGSMPPLTGTLTVTITDGPMIISDPFNVAELPDFIPCPPDEVKR